METIKNFRDIVTEEVNFKEAREISIKLLNRLSYSQAIMRGDFTFESNMDNLIEAEIKGTQVIASITESYNVTFWVESFDKSDKLEITFNIGMGTYYTYFAEEKDRAYYKDTNEVIGIQTATLVSLKLNGSEFKLDKKTRETAQKSIRNQKLYKNKTVLKEFKKAIEKKIKIPSKEETLKFPKIEKAFEKAKENLAKEKQAKLEKKNKEEFELQKLEAKIAKKEKVQGKKVAAANEETYIVFAKEGFDIEAARSLARSYDCEVWAIDRGYREAVEANDRIIRAMGELGNGTFHYVTHPGGNRSEAEIKF